MRMQDTAANCGPASLSNALAAVGIVRSQAECEHLCKTTGTDGTSAKNIIKAIKALDPEAGAVIKEKRQGIALLLLAHWLTEGHPVILCVDNGSHWVAAVGMLGRGRVLIADPADNELVLSLKLSDLLDRWTQGGVYYGVAL
jgi:ABC-type bacteriocin/lantibiotic exporter with double-glycine peptidase domain